MVKEIPITELRKILGIKKLKTHIPNVEADIAKVMEIRRKENREAMGRMKRILELEKGKAGKAGKRTKKAP